VKAIFIDKDGTLIEDVPYNVKPGLIQLTPHAGEALWRLQQAGFGLIVVTNQPGIARGMFTEAAMPVVKSRLDELLHPYDVRLTDYYYCPHSPDGVVRQYSTSCLCRKPMPGMLRRAASEHGIELHDSWMIGDILNDVEAGLRAGCRTVLIDNGNETEWAFSMLRVPDLFAPDLYSAALQIASLTASSLRGER
jgi:D,D-heptose 1,7-bisphosphate phosphatase